MTHNHLKKLTSYHDYILYLPIIYKIDKITIQVINMNKLLARLNQI